MRNALSTALAAAMLLGFSAGAGHATPGDDGRAPLIGQPDGPAATPQADQSAAEDGKARVVLRCIVNADRSVGHCVVASESPPGRGLGDAALRMSAQIRIQPETFEPGMVGSAVDIPMNFEREPDSGDMPGGVAASPPQAD